jgi:cytochrome c-type biogenesis protein
LTTAAATGTAVWGAVLLVCYSVGLGLPFIALGQGFGRATRSLAWFRRHGRATEIVGGALLVGIGLLYVTGEWQDIFLPLQRRFAEWNWPPI